jgi:predicted metal-dependent hydrolase
MSSSFSGKKEFIFGSFVYHYDLVMQDRKTLSLTVKPNLGITLKCPHGAGEERVEIFLKKKWFWLEKQLSFFKKYQRKVYQKEYVSGEGFLYLGKQYKLMVKKSDEDRVLMTKGLLLVETKKDVADGRYTKKLVSCWYSKNIARVFAERYKQVLSRFEHKKTPVLAIKEMQKRWGSYLNKNTVVLNPKLINAPKECIDYVIAHELCHIKYKNHNKNFYKFLNEKYPKWEKVKEKLETIGVNV